MKFKISVLETVKFEHELIVEVPEEEDIEEILNEVENECECFSDVGYTFEKNGCKVLEVCEDDSGAESEIEIPEYDEINDEDDD